jgi:mono/diheme cytochrome c family protein
MMKTIAGALLIAGLWAAPALAQPADPAAQKRFDSTCEACHGDGGAGGDRAPPLMNNPFLRTQSEAQIRELISNGTPGGMPSFKLPDGELRALAQWIHSLNMSAFDTKPAGNVAAGEAMFFGNGQCAGCHMVRGRGRANGPDLSAIGRRSTVRELELGL